MATEACNGTNTYLIEAEGLGKKGCRNKPHIWVSKTKVGESLRGNRIGATGQRAPERKSASERVSEREGFQRFLRGFERFSEVFRVFQSFLRGFQRFFRGFQRSFQWPSQRQISSQSVAPWTFSKKEPGERGAPRDHPEISSQKLVDLECRFLYDSYGRDRAPFWPFLGERILVKDLAAPGSPGPFVLLLLTLVATIRVIGVNMWMWLEWLVNHSPVNLDSE